MDASDIRMNMEVKTVFNLYSSSGMMVAPARLRDRKPDAEGVVRGFVPGHGGDVWWVEHKDGSVGAYSTEEFNPLDKQLPLPGIR